MSVTVRAGNVVEDDRQWRVLRQMREMGVDALLAGSVVIGRHHQRGICARILGTTEVLGSDAGVVRSGAGDDGYAALRLIDAHPNDREMLLGGQRCRFAGGAAGNERVRPLRDLPFDEIAIGRLDEPPLGVEGGDERGNRSGKHRLNGLLVRQMREIVQDR